MDIIFCFNLQGQLHSVPSSGSHHEMQHSMQGPVDGYGLQFETMWLTIFMNPR